MRMGLAAATALLAMSPNATAETEFNFAGQWTFEAMIQSDCTFGGTAFFERIEGDAFAGELTARQSCASLPEDYLVRQDCKATVFGNQVSVRCTIVEFVNGFESEYYFPDNFSLTVAEPDRLYGVLVSFGPTNPAEWRRAEGSIS
ncbi:MAG: hypothetical protein AAFO63_13455 [Pseudomonadota bacterium]